MNDISAYTALDRVMDIPGDLWVWMDSRLIARRFDMTKTEIEGGSLE